jgi:hypothetical protein
MAYNFTDATLLGYQVNKNYLGEGLFTTNTTKSISIEGIFLNLESTEGVTTSTQKIENFLTGIVNQYDSVIVNGYNLGSGKVLNLSFPEKNPIRLGRYVYDIEILENSDFSNAPSGDIYGTYLSGVRDKIVNLDENINFDYAENGDYSYNHGINIQFYDDKTSDLFTKSKDFANSAFYDNLNIGLIGPFSGFYNTLKNKKNYFTEAYDLINKKCSFSKKILINKNYNTNYTTTFNHSLNFESNGKITVEEQGVIKALDNTLNYTAENYLQDTINGGDLPDTIFLEGWANDEGNININGTYVYTYNTPIYSQFNTFVNGYKHISLNSLIYFDNNFNLWQLETLADPYQWNNSSVDPNILPLNGWILNNALGPAGTITKGSYARCQDIYNTYNQKYNLGQIDSLFNQPFTFGKTKDWFNNTLQYNVSYVNDPAFEGNVVNTYNITVSKDIQDIVNYSEQGDLTQVSQIGELNNLNTIKAKYQAAKTRASTSYPTYKLKNSSLSLGNLVGGTSLPYQINLNSWALDDFGQDINGKYTYTSSGVSIPYSGTFDGYVRTGSYRSYIYFDNNKWNQYSDGILSSVTDSDASSYISKAQVSNTNTQLQINSFVLGLKNLNLWNKFENLWIFKSGYNLPSGTSGFIDLKDSNFSGKMPSSSTSINQAISGYKFQNNSIYNFYYNNNSTGIKFTGANISMFSILESIKVAPSHLPYQTLLAPEVYQQSGFRFGVSETLGFRKWFRLWNTESIPSNGFAVTTNLNGQSSDYSFLSAGIQNSGTGFIQINDEPSNTMTGSYKAYTSNVNNFPAPAGGTDTLPNRLSFFGISKQNILNQHSGLKNLTKKTIIQNLDFPASIETWVNTSSSSPYILPRNNWIRIDNSNENGTISLVQGGSTYNNQFSYSIEKTSDNSIIENHPYYKSLTFKIDDQTPTNLYKEYIIPNRDIKNILFVSGNQVEIGNKTVNINGTLVRPTGNFWQGPISFPLNDLKSKSISGAFDLISTESFIDGISYEYDSDNNFSFNLNVKYLKKI